MSEANLGEYMRIYELPLIVGVLIAITFVVKDIFAYQTKRITRAALIMNVHLIADQEITLRKSRCAVHSMQVERDLAAAIDACDLAVRTDVLKDLEAVDGEWRALFEHIVASAIDDHDNMRTFIFKSPCEALIEAQHGVWRDVQKEINEITERHDALRASPVDCKQMT